MLELAAGGGEGGGGGQEGGGGGGEEGGGDVLMSNDLVVYCVFCVMVSYAASKFKTKTPGCHVGIET